MTNLVIISQIDAFCRKKSPLRRGVIPLFFHYLCSTKNLFGEKMIEIYEVTIASAKLSEALERLLPQLSQSAQIPSNQYVGQLLEGDNTHLFVAESEGEIVGMLSLVIVDIPTGRKAWIEDVVVDEAARGLHIGHALVEQAKTEAKALGAKKLYLTSNPSRKAAHALYSKCGFEEYDTSVFRINM